MNAEIKSLVAENLAELKAEISRLEKENHREPGSVKLIAVSKTKPAEFIEAAITCGQLAFGENKVQEMAAKQPALPSYVRWHLIGHLQSNKVKFIAPFVGLIHSVDSEKLLAVIDKQAALHQRIIPCLLQINISGEDQKSGMKETEAESLLRNIRNYPNVKILGLMGMAELTDNDETIRSQFRKLKSAFERFRTLENSQIIMQELSMGMSGDFHLAIAEGATMVRVGSRIFGERNSH